VRTIFEFNNNWKEFLLTEPSNAKLAIIILSTGIYCTLNCNKTAVVFSYWKVSYLLWFCLIHHHKLLRYIRILNLRSKGSRWILTPYVNLIIVIQCDRIIIAASYFRNSEILDKSWLMRLSHFWARNADTKLAVLIRAHRIHLALTRQKMTVLTTTSYLFYLDLKNQSCQASALLFTRIAIVFWSYSCLPHIRLAKNKNLRTIWRENIFNRFQKLSVSQFLFLTLVNILTRSRMLPFLFIPGKFNGFLSLSIFFCLYIRTFDHNRFPYFIIIAFLFFILISHFISKTFFDNRLVYLLNRLLT